MKRLTFIVLILMYVSCSNDDSDNDNQEIGNNIDKDLTGSLNLFPLALNPEFNPVSKVNLNDGTLVGIVNFGAEVHVYPYPFTVQ